MSGCFAIMKRRCRRSRVADENNIGNRSINGNTRYSGADFSFLWLLMKAPLACFIHNDPQASSLGGEEEERDGGRAEIYGESRRNARLRLWFANNPGIAERNYLAVQSSMRYVIQM